MANLPSRITFLFNEDQQPVRYYTRSSLPKFGISSNDTYVITTVGDRLDLLASQYYGSSNYYWVFYLANPDKLDAGSLFPPPGVQLRIPLDLQKILSSTQAQNLTGFEASLKK